MPPTKETTDSITFRLSRSEREQLDKAAQALNQDRTQVLQSAVAAFLDLYQWQMAEIETGLQQVREGQVDLHPDVMARWEQRRAALLE
jgi:predicted transcriptional regulator